MVTQRNDEGVAECACCGGPVILPFGKRKDFCSDACLKKGRTFCLHPQCPNQLVHNKHGGNQRDFCCHTCSTRYYRGYIGIGKRAQIKCKECDNLITQHPKGPLQVYCCKNCGVKHRRALKQGQNPHEAWGIYPPEMRKVFRELESLGLNNTATRLTTAIQREYVRRKICYRNPSSDHIKGQYTTHTCLMCKGKFRRMVRSQQSKEYCSVLCIKKAKIVRGELEEKTHLTWEQVDEIRSLYATGMYSYRAIGEIYGMAAQSILSIVKYKHWKPERDPRKKINE